MNLLAKIKLLQELQINLASIETFLGWYGCFLLGQGRLLFGGILFACYLLIGNVGYRLFWKLIKG